MLKLRYCIKKDAILVKSVLFVCLGNICRSPLAEGLARELVQKMGIDLKVDSAATSHYHIGEPPCDYSQRIAKEHGFDISDIRARKVQKEENDRFDLIVAMDRQNIETLKNMGVDAVLLGEFGGYGGIDVPDPYFFPTFESGMQEVFTMIEGCTEDLLERIRDGKL